MRKSALLLVVLGVCSFALLQLLLLQVWRPQLSDRIWIVHAAQRMLSLRECLEGVVTVQRGGRFGNVFMEYASALGVARTHNLTLVLSESTASAMKEVFEAVEEPTIEEYLKGRSRADGTPCSSRLSEEDFIETPHRWKEDEREPVLQGAGPIVIGRWIVHEKYVASVASILRTKLRFLPELREHAQNVLRTLGKEVANATGTRLEEVVFIGVHSRRTDYITHIQTAHNVNQLADEPYFLHAVDWLRQALAPPPPLALVVTSDDMDWVQEHLVPAFQRHLDEQKISSVRAFAAGGGTEADALKDLALLSACNHTVVAYGTYAITGALLAGGYTVVFDVAQPEYHTLRMARQFKNWTVIQ